MKSEVKIEKFNPSHTLTVTVKITREFKVRIWLAKKLIQAAAYVLGCKSEIKEVGLERD